jgi:hypothetical protein
MVARPDLIERARAVTLDSMRICVRSAALIERCVLAMRNATDTHERALVARAERLAAREAGMPRCVPNGWVESVRPLPLTPPMLLELADEFRLLADRADTPDSSAAFHNLALRYTALAAGYDTEQTSSRMVH